MHFTKIARAAALGSAITVGTVVAIQAPAWAFAVDQFDICVTPSYRSACSSGTVSWGQRTAAISGTVIDEDVDGYTTVIFESYAGATKIQSQTRTANDSSSLGDTRDFAFSIGDPDLVGGIDRIKITVRQTRNGGVNWDSPTYQLHRDNTAENIWY
jgi:hypothetical protein